MTRWPWAAAVLVLGVGCTREGKEGPAARAEIRRVSGSTMEVVPNDGQLPYCLLYTVSQKGVIRQLTMTRENRSIKCETGRPIANTSFRIPAQEGPVKVYVIFSDQRIPAGSVAQQLYELRDRHNVSGMDFRLHGQAFVEQLDFIPEEDEAPVTGGVVGEQGEVAEGMDTAPSEATGGSPPEDGGT
ncbi:hypothetical protein POL68_14125 [Stigmatella sp. ncwal1]|uniref:Lipoprotein n=1 Tax=Stigmatella ashevillensis TaxID=2995309 RepID=A0ABT5D7G2_9BACT|nr:hypothetical protein [Stigmatella ashevillena]MDC0709604.1 hypothetical protein [Stigmatella ashevillena]